MPEAVVRLRRPIERAIAAGHPWIYRDALVRMRAQPGEVVTVLGTLGAFVARGIADAGPIGVRVFTTGDEPVDSPLFSRRIAEAIALRDRIVPADTDAYRVLHGEGDRLPGFVCDRYAGHAVLALDGEGAIRWKDVAVAALRDALAPRGVETLLVRSGRRAARTVEVGWGRAPERPVVVRERGMTLLADLVRGQKTGLFLDHRDSRARVRAMSRGLRVLNLYGYTGAFSVAAGLGGAKAVYTVDSAKDAIAFARETWRANGLDDSRHDARTMDVSEFLAEAARRRAELDLVVSDPPSFAPNEKSVARALEAYRALHAASLGLLVPGGRYLAASCSSHVGAEAFEETIAEGARRAGVPISIVDRWGAPPDHPTIEAFPEGEYLKVRLVRTGRRDQSAAGGGPASASPAPASRTRK